MIKLTANQAETLLKIVFFANQNGGRVPTGPEFAKTLGIGTRGALARIRRISERTDFFKKAGKTLYIDYDQIITEKESAELCLKIIEFCKESENGRISNIEITNLIGLGTRECKELIKKYCDAEYLYRIAPNIPDFRAGAKLFNHFEYLKCLAET